MKTNARNLSLWVALIALVLLGILWGSPGGTPGGRFKALPLTGPGFVGRDLPLDEVERQVYQRAESLKRLYLLDDTRFVLTAIDGTGNRHAVHDPLYCFRGAGWQVASEHAITVPGGEAKWLQLSREGHQTEVVFWFSNAGEHHTSASRAWKLGLWHRLSFGRGGSETALVVLQPGEDASPNWTNLFARFPLAFQL